MHLKKQHEQQSLLSQSDPSAFTSTLIIPTSRIDETN